MLDISYGTVVWSSLAFIIVMLILAKMAWKPILGSIRDRENSIAEALQSAKKAREEMEALRQSNESLLQEAKAERDALMRDARDTKDKILEEARQKAESEYSRIVDSARETIETEKRAALAELKNQVATLSLEIAEKVIRQELTASTKQQELVNQYLNEVKLN